MQQSGQVRSDAFLILCVSEIINALAQHLIRFGIVQHLCATRVQRDDASLQVQHGYGIWHDLDQAAMMMLARAQRLLGADADDGAGGLRRDRFERDSFGGRNLVGRVGCQDQRPDQVALVLKRDDGNRPQTRVALHRVVLHGWKRAKRSIDHLSLPHQPRLRAFGVPVSDLAEEVGGMAEVSHQVDSATGLVYQVNAAGINAAYLHRDFQQALHRVLQIARRT